LDVHLPAVVECDLDLVIALLIAELSARDGACTEVVRLDGRSRLPDLRRTA
jgi:hypothetical protein